MLALPEQGRVRHDPRGALERGGFMVHDQPLYGGYAEAGGWGEDT